jgi:hypothetical protein
LIAVLDLPAGGSEQVVNCLSGFFLRSGHRCFTCAAQTQSPSLAPDGLLGYTGATLTPAVGQGRASGWARAPRLFFTQWTQTIIPASNGKGKGDNHEQKQLSKIRFCLT